MNKDRLIRQLTNHMWETEGRPCGICPGEANRRTYEREAKDVLEALEELGYVVKKANAKK